MYRTGVMPRPEAHARGWGPIAAVAGGKRQLSNADARMKARSFADRYGKLLGSRLPTVSCAWQARG